MSLNLNSSTGRRTIQIENKSSTLYRMFYAIQMFYANGGGEAFVISVGDLTDPINQGQIEQSQTTPLDRQWQNHQQQQKPFLQQY